MYAVFVDDDLYEIFPSKEEAKAAAEIIREEIRWEGRKTSVYIKMLTRKDKEMLGLM